jgi:hypothetical protein
MERGGGGGGGIVRWGRVMESEITGVLLVVFKEAVQNQPGARTSDTDRKGHLASLA